MLHYKVFNYDWICMNTTALPCDRDQYGWRTINILCYPVPLKALYWLGGKAHSRRVLTRWCSEGVELPNKVYHTVSLLWVVLILDDPCRRHFPRHPNREGGDFLSKHLACCTCAFGDIQCVNLNG